MGSANKTYYDNDKFPQFLFGPLHRHTRSDPLSPSRQAQIWQPHICKAVCSITLHFVTQLPVTVQRVLVLNLVEISKDFRITETRFDSEPVCYFWINILLAVFVPHVHVNTQQLCAHLLSSYEYLVNMSISVVVLHAHALNKCITMSPRWGNHAKPPPKLILREFDVSPIRPRLGGLPHLETFTWHNLTLSERVTWFGRSGFPRIM